MKNIISTLSLLFLFVYSEAQITITSADMPSPGDTITTSTALNTMGLDFEITGENYLWDFSSLTSIGKEADTFKSVTETPLIYQLVFLIPPNQANLAIYEGSVDTISQMQITDIYQFLNNSNSSFKHVGAAFTINGLPFPMKFDSPDLLYELPLNYNDNYNSVSNFETSFPGLGYYKTRKTRSSIVDGWGEVITPYGQFSALRVKSDIIQYDSIYLDSLGFGFPSTRNYTEYKWLANGMGIPVIQFNQEGLIVSATYIDSAETHQFVPTHELQSGFSVYPNPTTGLVYLKNNSGTRNNLELIVYNLSGQQILSKNLPNNIIYPLNLKSHGIAKGVHFIAVKSNSEIVYREKLILK